MLFYFFYLFAKILCIIVLIFLVVVYFILFQYKILRAIKTLKKYYFIIRKALKKYYFDLRAILFRNSVFITFLFCIEDIRNTKLYIFYKEHESPILCTLSIILFYIIGKLDWWLPGVFLCYYIIFFFENKQFLPCFLLSVFTIILFYFVFSL